MPRGFPQHRQGWEGTSGHLNSCFLLWGSLPPAPLLSFEVGQLLQTGRSSSTAFSDAGQCPGRWKHYCQPPHTEDLSPPPLSPQEAETGTFSSNPFCRADSKGNEANLRPGRLSQDFRGLPPFPHSLSTCWLHPPRVKGLTAGQDRPGPCP